MSNQAIRFQLETMRRQLAAMDAQIESVLFYLDGVELDQTHECDHPEDRRLNLTTMGSPEKWECKDCGYVYDESKEDDE